MPSRRPFGALRKLPSGRWQASYIGPDLIRRTAPTTFTAKIDGDAWLHDTRRRIERGEWTPGGAAPKPQTLAEYADAWLAARELKPRTRSHYRSLLDRLVTPTLGATPVKALSVDAVRSWWSKLDSSTPTQRSHAYGLLHVILGDAVTDGLLPLNPARIRGAANVKRVHQIRPATLDELDALTTAMPPRYRPMVLLAAWAALRFGELIELRRSDLDLTAGVIRVRRGAVRVDGAVLVGTPKSAAGTRDVAIPPHLLPAMREHLTANVNGRDGLLFPAADGVNHLAPSTLYRHFYRARAAAGRPDLRFHDLRHTGATMASAAGATIADAMARLGHSTAGAALRYQHAAAGRDVVIAAALSELVQADRRGS